MLNLLVKEQRSLYMRLVKCETCINSLKSQACKAYETNNYSRCTVLLDRVNVLELYRVKLYTIKAWRKVA